MSPKLRPAEHHRAAATQSRRLRGMLGAGLLALAALTIVLAGYVAGREAPRESGDLVQLWIVPESSRSAEVGLRNGLATDLQCSLDLPGDGAAQQLTLVPGETVASRVDTAASPIEVSAACTDGIREFRRRVVLDGS